MFCYFNTKNIGHLVDPTNPAVAVVCHCHVSTYMCLLSFPLQTTSSTRKRRREPLGWSRIVPRLQGITINRDKLILDLGTFAGDDASKFLELTPPVQEVVCGIAGWKDIIIKKLVSVPTIHTRSKASGRPLKDATTKSLQCLKDHFRNTSEMEAVIRVAVIVLDAVMGTNLKVQLQPSVKNHATFTDFYFIIAEQGEDISRAFIEVKNSSVSVVMDSEIKPVAQALREAQIIIEMLPNSTDITLPFILTNSHHWISKASWRRKNFH